MRSLRLLANSLIALVICAACSGVLAQDKGKMSNEEKAKVINLLIDSNKATINALEHLSDEQLNFRSAPGKWSIAEVAEHIMLAESLIFSAVERALAADPNPEWQAKTSGKTQLLEKALIDRHSKAQAPESIVPSGKLTRVELIAKLKESREKTLKFAEETQLPLKYHTFDHPFPIFGTLNAYQWLFYIPLHNFRHNLQIAEIRTSPGFPKK